MLEGERNRRILVVDDNAAIHEDFRKVLCGSGAGELDAFEALLFGEAAQIPVRNRFEIESAYQGQTGLEKVRSAIQASRPYAMAFVDVRMPPGWDGVETAARLWECAPDLQVVICTAFSDYSWDEMLARLPYPDQVLILKKPFDNVEVLQLATALTEKWHLVQIAKARVGDLERSVAARTAQLEAEIAERKLTEAALREAKLAAEAANLTKSAFLANMSHEIRTPMNGIVGVFDLLSLGCLSSEHREMVQIGKNSSEALLLILNDILDFSKIEAGKMRIEAADFDLLTLVESVAGMVSHLAASKGVDLLTQVDPEAPARLSADAGRLRQVLLNLLGNALKFTSEGEVRLEVNVEALQETGARLRFAIHDTGIGISSGHQAELFQPFSQVHNTSTRRYGGTGLGLAISRRLVELMGGRIGVDSEPGRGSTFWFELSLAIVPGGEKPQARLQQQRILIVGNRSNQLQNLKNNLTRWGAATGVAESGAIALSVLSRAIEEGEKPYDAVIVDSLLADMSGLDWVTMVRQAAMYDSTQLILMVTPNELQASSAHFSGFHALTKPIRLGQLRDYLVRATPVQLASAVNRVPGFAARTGPSSSILLVEDNAINGKIALSQLSRLGYSVDIAANGAEAVEAFRKNSYPIILMDCQMPGMDGWEASRLIRQMQTSPVRIVAMTASVMEEDRQRCRAAGMDDYVSKPVCLNQLEDTLQRNWTALEKETPVAISKQEAFHDECRNRRKPKPNER